jgi:hypothetical protein
MEPKRRSTIFYVKATTSQFLRAKHIVELFERETVNTAPNLKSLYKWIMLSNLHHYHHEF